MNDVVVDVRNVTIRFNLASEKIDNLKEYVIKVLKRELLFQEFLAVKDASFQIRRVKISFTVSTFSGSDSNIST